MITNVGLNLLRDALKGDVSDAQIKYVAWGDDDTAPALTNTALGNEVGRKAVTSRAAGGPGIVDTIVYIARSEAVGTIKEIGFFAGASASATPGSGVLYSRILYSKVKTALEAIQIELTDTLAEA